MTYALSKAYDSPINFLLACASSLTITDSFLTSPLPDTLELFLCYEGSPDGTFPPFTGGFEHEFNCFLD